MNLQPGGDPGTGPVADAGADAAAIAGSDPAATADRETVSADQLSLARRLRQPRTIISLVLPILLLALFAKSLPGFKLEELPGIIFRANGLLLLAALGIFYVGFPLRGYRWALLVRRSGFNLGVRDATEIIFLSWLVNCLVPAKLGDVYRAYLLKINSTVSLSRTFGTVFIERILDLFAIGVVVVVVLAGGLLTLRNFGRRILDRLPVPHRVIEFYDRFEEGVFGSIGLRALPRLIVLTGFIWATEATRLYLVVQALGLPDVHLGISGAFFVALSASLLTAVPLTPAGIGFVEGGIVGLLTLVYGIPQNEALAITLVDRTVSVLSIIVLGSIAYAISPKRRGAGLTNEVATA